MVKNEEEDENEKVFPFFMITTHLLFMKIIVAAT